MNGLLKRCIQYLAALLISLFSLSVLHADDRQLRQENFSHLTIEDGLPQNSVRCIEEDQYGVLWLCTSDGLVRYDGYEFELVTEGVDGSRITSTYIREIYADGDSLWIGTRKGLSRFKLSDGVFESIKLNEYEKNASEYIQSIFKVDKGEIWVGTKSGIYTLRYSENTVSNIQKIDLNINARKMLLVGTKVIVSNYGKEILAVDTNTKKLIASKKLEGKNANNIIDISLHKNKLYLSTYGSGLIIVDLNFNTIETIQSCNEKNYECLSSNYLFFSKIYEGEIWLGSLNGFSIFDETTLAHKKNLLLTDFITNKYISNSIRTALFTKDTLWFGLDPGGLVIYKHGMDGIKQYFTDNIDTNLPITDKSVYTVFSNKNNVFVGTYMGLFHINDITNALDPVKSVNSRLDISSSRISYMCSYDNNNLFLSTKGGLFKYSIEDDYLERINLQNKINDQQFRAISCNNDRVLMSTGHGYFYLYDVKQDVFKEVKTQNEIKMVHSIFDDEFVYLATSNGMKITTIKNNILTEIDTLLKDSLITKVVPIESRIFIATGGEGLFILNKNNRELLKVALDYQAIGNTIYDIETINNKLWLSTNNGLVELDLLTLQYTHYVQSHGLSDKEYSMGGLFYNKKKNTLFAGGLTGLTQIDLDVLKEINDIEIGNIISKISVVDSKGKTIKSYYNNPSAIDVDEGSTLLLQLGHKYSATRFKSNFHYTIEKFHNNVINPLRPNQRLISLVDISGNDFKLSIGDNNQYSLDVNVTPYIWKRWWSFLIYITIIYFLIKFFVSHYKSIQESKNREILSNKELALKRKQLASLSHELRTPLNAIIGITDATKAEQDIQYIRSSAYLLRSLIDNALDSISMEMRDSINITEVSFDIKKLINNVIIVLDLYIKSSNIDVVINIDADVPSTIISDKIRVQQIILNLVKNAIKHSKTASQIKIDVSVINDELLISVADNGIGITYEDQVSIFDAFYKVASKQSGFGLGLYISKLVSHHLGGNLMVDSAPGDGCKFTLTIPLKTSEVKLPQEVKSAHDRYIKFKRILILEDDPLSIYALKLQLDGLGITNYSIVDNYSDFMEKHHSSYDSILLDLNFGHDSIDGIQLARNLKEEGYQGELYILTAESDPSIKKDALNYVVDYLVKPVSKATLEEILFVD